MTHWAILAVIAAASCSRAPTPSERTSPSRRAGDFVSTRAAVAPGTQFPQVFAGQSAGAPSVIVVASSRCQEFRRVLGTLHRVERRVRESGGSIVYLYCDPRDSVEAIGEFHRRHSLQGEPVIDLGQSIARRLGANAAGDAILVDADGIVAYRGAVEVTLPRTRPWRPLEEALDAVGTGVRPTVSVVPVPG